MDFGTLEDAQDSYTRLGWPVRVLGGGVVVLTTGRSVDVLESTYSAAMLALGRWEQTDDPGPIATDGITAWCMVRAGRYPWPGRVAAHAAATIRTSSSSPAVRWHAGTGLPLPPTRIGDDRDGARVWWLTAPKERHTPDDQGLPHPLEVAELLGEAIDDLLRDGPALRIGKRALLVAAPASAKQLRAVQRENAKRAADALSPAAEARGKHAEAGEAAAGDETGKTDQDAEGQGEAAEPQESPVVAVPGPSGRLRPEEDEVPNTPAKKSKRVRVSWPGGPSRPVTKLEQIVELLERLDARADGRGGLVVVEHPNGPRLSIGVGTQYSVLVWVEEGARRPYLISRGDENGTAVKAARADADPDPDVVFIAPGGRVVFLPTTAAISAEVARRAVVEFANSGKRPTGIEWDA